MSFVYVNPEELKRLSAEEQNLSSLIRQLAAETRNVRMTMDYEIRAKEQITRKLSGVEEMMSEKAAVLHTLSSRLEEVSSQYLRTEKENVSLLHAESPDSQGGNGIDYRLIESVVRPWIVIPPGPRPTPFVPRPLPWPYAFPLPRPVPPYIFPKPFIWSVISPRVVIIPPAPAPRPMPRPAPFISPRLPLRWL